MINGQQSYNQRHHAFLSEAVVSHGPPTLLGRFFLHTARFAEERGITLKFCQPEELAFVNRQNRDNWMPLAPMYDPSFNKLNERNYIGLLGFTQNGKIVTANAVRLYDWQDTNFEMEAKSLRFMYDAPKVSKLPTEYCEVSAPSAGQIRGLAAFSGAAWVHPDMRGCGLGHLLPLATKVLAVTRWQPHTIMGVMSNAVHSAGFAQPFGFDHAEFEILWHNSPLGTLRLALLWTDCNHVIEEARQRIEPSAPKVDFAIRHGHASH
jgi:hypothetical protein